MASSSAPKSSFSRQIFCNFLLSAILPVLVLAFFTYVTINEQFEDSINEQVYSESRSLGLSLFDRLRSLESGLGFLASVIQGGARPDNYKWLMTMFDSAYIYENDKVDDVIYGDTYINFNLNDKQYRHLHTDALLTLVSNEDNYELLMLIALDHERGQYLVGVINVEHFWNLTTRETDFFCASIIPGQVLSCSGAGRSINRQLMNIEVLKPLKRGDYFSIDIDGTAYVGNTWELYIEPQFGLNNIKIHYFIPGKAAFMEYDFYSKVFPQTIAITLLLVYLLSSIQVRKLLKPLRQLGTSAKNIIAGEYSHRVDVSSNNEFETLGKTFNDMSARIEEQIKELQTLSKLDRLILSNPDTDYIVDVLLRYLPTVVTVNNVAIIVFDTSAVYMGKIHYCRDNGDVEKTSLILGDDDYREFEEAKSVYVKNVDGNEGYLAPLKKFKNQHFLIAPIKDRENLLGVLVLGQTLEQHNTDEQTEMISILADRAAVALSNANWEKKLFNQAHYDELTSLPNRFLFKDRFEQSMERARRNDTAVSILFIDLDRFKSINDSLGHDIGDRLLQEVAKRFMHCVRAYDSVARFGGDEFVIIITDVEVDHIQEQSAIMAERIINAMKQPILLDDREFFVSPSIGIAFYPNDGATFDELLKRADTAMYQAKTIPTANFQFYEKELNDEPLLRLELESELMRALDNEQLKLYYQPKINLRDGKVYDVEALIRWSHPQKGIILPEVFIPLAEETGMIAEIGYWVFREACRQNRQWHEQGIDLNVAINISSDQFRQPAFFERVVAILNETGVNPHNLELEITESIYIDNHEKTTALLNRLKEYGMDICMDDFGTGYSSMTYLQKIPVDKLKIDKSFVDKIGKDKESASIVKAIITLAHSLDLRVVAEGVETREQYVYLNAVSCDEAQGFFLCHPLPGDEALDYIREKNDQAENVE